VRTVAAWPPYSTLARTWVGAITLLHRRGSPARPPPDGGGWCSSRSGGALPGSGGYTMRAPRFRPGLVACGRAVAWVAMVGRRRRDGVVMAALRLAAGTGWCRRRRRRQPTLLVVRVGRWAGGLAAGRRSGWPGGASLVAAVGPGRPCRPLRATACRSPSSSSSSRSISATVYRVLLHAHAPLQLAPPRRLELPAVHAWATRRGC
jgi:hypothetical protein